MTRIVTSTYRYKHPPKKRKAVALEVPAIVTRSDGKRHRVSRQRDASDEAAKAMAIDAPAIVTRASKSALAPKHSPANADRRSAIVTVRRKGKRFADVSDLAPEELQRRADAADAMFREMKRRLAAKDRL